MGTTEATDKWETVGVGPSAGRSTSLRVCLGGTAGHTNAAAANDHDIGRKCTPDSEDVRKMNKVLVALPMCWYATFAIWVVASITMMDQNKSYLRCWLKCLCVKMTWEIEGRISLIFIEPKSLRSSPDHRRQGICPYTEVFPPALYVRS